MPHNVEEVLTAFVAAATSTLKATVTIPEPIEPIPSQKPTPTFLPPPWPHPEAHRYHGIGKFGHITAWVVFGIFVLSFLGFSVSLFRASRTKRVVHYVLAALAFFGSATYYAVATGTGSTFIVAGVHDLVWHHKQIFFVHWIGWLLTGPLVLWTLAVLVGLSVLETLAGIAALEAGLAFNIIGIFAYASKWHHHGANHGFKWAWVAYSLVALAYTGWVFLITGRKIGYARSAPLGRVYTFLSLYLFTLWTALTIIIILTYYVPLIHVKLVELLFGIIDVFTLLGFGAGLLVGVKREGLEILLPATWVGEEEIVVGNSGYVGVPAHD